LLDKNDILERKNKMKKFFFNRKILHILTVLTIMSILLLLKYCLNSNYTQQTNNFVIKQIETTIQTSINLTNETINIKIFNLMRQLEPISMYDNIKCRESILNIVKTTICVHDLKDDVHVSKYKIRDFESNKNKGSRIEKKNRVK
jgi:hypothetical protein